MLRSLAALAATALVLVACSAETGSTDEADPNATSDDALTSSPKSVSLLYEGTCEFLHNCSSWSRKLPDNDVQWGCGGTTCSNDDNWMAGPSRAYCNKKVKVCRNGTCTTAVIKDISDVHGWEASNGVMDDLGLSHTVNVDRCAGSGGGRVTVQVL